MELYAFDWGGVMNVNPELQTIAKELLAAGHQIFIISVAWPHENREEHVRKCGIPFTGIYVIEETGFTQHGVEKIKIMKQLGCRVIFDDNQDVINHAKKAGFLAIKVSYKDH